MKGYEVIAERSYVTARECVFYNYRKTDFGRVLIVFRGFLASGNSKNWVRRACTTNTPPCYTLQMVQNMGNLGIQL